jgi:hypothetical protein
LIVRPDATFAILIDTVLEKEGNLFYDLSPGFPRGASATGLDKKPAEITGIGFETFDVDFRLAFSKILIADDEEAVKRFNEESFLPRKKAQEEAIPEADLNDLAFAAARAATPVPTPAPEEAKKKREKIGFAAALAKAGVQIGSSLKVLIGDVSPVIIAASATGLVFLLLVCCRITPKAKTD